jgi:hypothetical protein
MTEERIITGIEVTHGGAPDCDQFPVLLEKTIENGVWVKEAVGDMAYVSEDDLDVCEEKGVTLYARTSSAASAAAATPLDEGFCFNKDAGLLQCPAGKLAMRADKRAAENGNTYPRYMFSKVKCKKCPLREQCRVGQSKSKESGYSITKPSEKNRQRLELENSEPFRERLRIRHRIEEKNGEMKVAHGLGRADSVCLTAMPLQTYFTAFTVNVKRIVKLMELNPA